MALWAALGDVKNSLVGLGSLATDARSPLQADLCVRADSIDVQPSIRHQRQRSSDLCGLISNARRSGSGSQLRASPPSNRGRSDDRAPIAIKILEPVKTRVLIHCDSGLGIGPN